MDQLVGTLGDVASIDRALNGEWLLGRNEPRIALVGRSNVGKSSLINALLGGKSARVSKTPGKTQTLNVYHWEGGRSLLVDLPGYGFAERAKTEKEKWSGWITHYLTQDPKLKTVAVILDARHGPTETDCEAIRFLSFKGLPVTLVFNKLDALKNQSERAKRVKEVAGALQSMGIGSASVYWISVRDKTGLKAFVHGLLQD